MGFWHFEDKRYQGHRGLLIFSVIGGVAAVLGIVVLLGTQQSPTRSTATARATPAAEATPTPAPGPDQIQKDRIAELRRKISAAAEQDNRPLIESLTIDLLNLDPSDPTSWSNLAVARQKRGALSEAVSTFDRAVEVSGHSSDMLIGRARALREQGKLDVAIRDLEEAAAVEPGNVVASNLLMIVRIENGQADEVRGIVASNQAAEIQSTAELWLFGAAALALHDNDVPGAVEYFGRFRTVSGATLAAQLLRDPFFDPYRNDVALVPYFLRPAE